MGNSMRPPGDESARLAQNKYPEGHSSREKVSPGENRTKSRGVGLIVLVLLLAAALRIYHITQQSIWFDEAFAWNIVMQHDMYPRIAADTHPPLYYVLLRGWVTVAGDSALALRYLSAMFSMVTVALVYQVGRAMVQACGVAQGRERLASVPLLAALVIALSDAEIFLAQESRNYALYTMTASLSMWFYLRWISTSSTVQVKDLIGQQTPPLNPLPAVTGRGLDRPSADDSPPFLASGAGTGGWGRLRNIRSHINSLGWVLATAALIYTHYHGLFIPAVQGLHALLFLRGRKRLEAIGLLIAIGLVFLPWFLGVTLPQAQHAIDNSLPYAIASNWQTFLHLRDSYLGDQWALMAGLALLGLGAAVWNQRLRRGVLMPVNNLVGQQTPPLNPRSDRSPYMARGLYKPAATGSHPFPVNGEGTGGWGLTGKFTFPDFSTAFILFMWFAIPFGVLYFGNLFSALLTERKLLIVVPAISLMIGFGLGWLSSPARGLLAAALILYGLTSVDFYRVKEPWREIAAEPLPYIQPTDLAMVEAGVGQYAMKYYWDHLLPEGVYMTTFPFPQIRDWTLAPTTDGPTYYDALLPQLLEETRANRIGQVATVWFVYWDKEQTNFQRLAEAGYVRTMTISHDHLGNSIDLYRYDHLPEGALADFENGMILRAAEFDLDALRVDLWWETDMPLTADYTTSVKLFDTAGNLVAQKDAPPRQSTSTWSATSTIYDGKFLDLLKGDALPPGQYTITAEIYLWTPDRIINQPMADGAERFEIGMESYEPAG